MNDKYIKYLLKQLNNLEDRLNQCETSEAEDILADMIDNLKSLIMVLLKK